jgi:hypothetical protein
MIKHRFSQVSLLIGAVALLLTPAFGQGRGKGVGGAAGAAGGVVGGVPATATGAVNGTSRGKGPQGGAVGHPESVTFNGASSVAISKQLGPLLPAGTTVEGGAAGFKNQGEFISAVHVAHNLDIPFDQIKAQMTAEDAASLGDVIKTLRPQLDTKAIKDNVKLAERQTDRDLRQARAGNKPDKVAKSISSDSRLAARLTTMLPPEMTLNDAATGFKNQGQFIAALQTSSNLGIPFADLKDRMTAGQSLGQSIHALKPSMTEAEADASAKVAEEQAKEISLQASAQTTVGTK